jgi:hypothetical protein
MDVSTLTLETAGGGDGLVTPFSTFLVSALRTVGVLPYKCIFPKGHNRLYYILVLRG